MVTATLVAEGMPARRVHWPCRDTVDSMQIKICRRFDINWREFKVLVRHGDRVLFGFERPWFFMPRRVDVEAEIAFEKLSTREMRERALIYIGDGSDDSSGYSTPAEIEAAMQTIEDFVFDREDEGDLL